MRSSESTDHLNLLICGAARSGTTTLKSYLAEHPEIAFIGERDLYVEDCYVGYPFATPFYSRSQIGEDLTVYRAMSRRLAGRVRYIGTKWPYFMMFPHIAGNIRAHLPDVRLLFILRNPTDTFYSCFWRQRQKEKVTFDEFLDRELAAIEQLWVPQQRACWPALIATPEDNRFFLERGFYYQQLRHYFNLFPADQILVLRFEDFISQPAEGLRRVLSFLDLNTRFEFENMDRKMNSGVQYSPMSPGTRSRLNSFYADSNRSLCNLLDWPLEPWL